MLLTLVVGQQPILAEAELAAALTGNEHRRGRQERPVEVAGDGAQEVEKLAALFTVEYSITPLGGTLAEALAALQLWAGDHIRGGGCSAEPLRRGGAIGPLRLPNGLPTRAPRVSFLVP